MIEIHMINKYLYIYMYMYIYTHYVGYSEGLGVIVRDAVNISQIVGGHGFRRLTRKSFPGKDHQRVWIVEGLGLKEGIFK